jgi:hypothetical protein
MQRLGARRCAAARRVRSARKSTTSHQRAAGVLPRRGQLIERKYVDQPRVAARSSAGPEDEPVKTRRRAVPAATRSGQGRRAQMFEVKEAPAAADDPGGTVHVQLVPKKGTAVRNRFRDDRLLGRSDQPMPVRIVTADPNGATTRTTELKDIKVNADLGDKDSRCRRSTRRSGRSAARRTTISRQRRKPIDAERRALPRPG